MPVLVGALEMLGRELGALDGALLGRELGALDGSLLGAEDREGSSDLLGLALGVFEGVREGALDFLLPFPLDSVLGDFVDPPGDSVLLCLGDLLFHQRTQSWVTLLLIQ